MRRRWPSAALGIALALGGCGDEDAEPVPTTTTERGRPPADLVELRPVEEVEGPPPCRSGSFAGDGACFVLGPAAVDAHDVAEARRAGDEIELRLTEDGLAAFNAMAAQVFEARGQVAVLVDGRVVSAPSVMESYFEGPISLVGATEAETTRLVDAFGP